MRWSEAVSVLAKVNTREHEMNFGYFNELKRSEQEKLAAFANRADIAVVVFCACLMIAWVLGGFAGCQA